MIRPRPISSFDARAASLAGLAPALVLPKDHRRHGVQSFNDCLCGL